MKVNAVIVMELDLDDYAEGDPSTEQAREVVREFGERVRHRLLAEGLRVGAVRSALTDQQIGGG